EMQDFCAAFAASGCQVFPHLPIHRGFEGVLDRQRPALDKEIALQRRQAHHAAKSLHESAQGSGANVRIGNLELCGIQQPGLYLGLRKVVMTVSNRQGRKKPVEIEELAAGYRIHQVGSPALLNINDDLKSVEQNMLLELGNDSLWRKGSRGFHLTL